MFKENKDKTLARQRFHCEKLGRREGIRARLASREPVCPAVGARVVHTRSPTLPSDLQSASPGFIPLASLAVPK